MARPYNTSMNDLLPSWRAAADEAARRGAAVLEQWRARFSVREKARADLVTRPRVPREIHSPREVPDLGFPGEDPSQGGASTRPSRRIVDLLDGTANYVTMSRLTC